MLIQSIEKSFLIDPLTTNNGIYRDSLILSNLDSKIHENAVIVFCNITTVILLLIHTLCRVWICSSKIVNFFL